MNLSPEPASKCSFIPRTLRPTGRPDVRDRTTSPTSGRREDVRFDNPDDLETHVREFVQPPFALSADLAAEAMCTFRHRWWMMLTDLHWAGAMLNPVLRGWAPVHKHEQSRRILNQVF